MKYPKILVISHNCFSASGSNGRTLANFFDGYPTENLAQFYIFNEMPSIPVCDKYYRVTDRDAVRSLFSGKGGAELKRCSNLLTPSSSATGGTKLKRTPLVYLIRETVWKLGHWNNHDLHEWIDRFSPDIVLFQAGDAAFLFEFARKISQIRKIPLVIYNSESYYFKETNYLSPSLLSSFWYGIFRKYFRTVSSKTIRHAKRSIYISEALKETYDEEFGLPSTTVMTSSTLLGSVVTPKPDGILISYLGNLGIGRSETLIELGRILSSIDPKLHIDVYGRITPDMEAKLQKAEGIRYRGFVSYDDCVKIMKHSTILIHVENFSEFYLSDSKYAFSTKIADSLASGTCFFVYAPKSLACTEYLIRTHAACVVSDPEKAKKELIKLINSETYRQQYVHRAQEIAAENHSAECNRQKFLDALFN